MKVVKHSAIRNHTVTAILLLFAMLIMVSPAFANSGNYSWLAYQDFGYVIDGSVNGIFYNMTAGSLTNNGSLWVTAAYPNATNPPAYFKIAVKKSVIGPDPTICTTAKIYPSLMVGSQYAVSYTKSCGTISAGTYYMYIYRNAIDGREVQGNGTIQTP
ncbi:MAG: hypothetical protein Fur0022_15030 [Anaerolineales bacterium]